MLALLLAGNLFCMGCPFTLPRTLARKISLRDGQSGRGRRWPRRLRNKWLAIGVFVAYLWLYEALDLWARPWLDGLAGDRLLRAAFVLEALFAKSPFCKYICPLGTFNFVASTVSPLQITARRVDVCRICVGKECVNGSAQTLGCGTELFVPQIKSNLDCTFCLDCARACPHDNVALAVRKPLSEFRPVSIRSDSTGGAWPQRWDVAFLALVFAFAGLANGFGMTPAGLHAGRDAEPGAGHQERSADPGADLRSADGAAASRPGPGSRLAQPAPGCRAGRSSQPGQPAGGLRPLRAHGHAAGLRHLVRALLVPLSPAARWPSCRWCRVSCSTMASPCRALVSVRSCSTNQTGRWARSCRRMRCFCWCWRRWPLASWRSLYSLSRTAAAEGTPTAARRAMLPWLALWAALALAALLIFSLPMEMRGMIG